MRLSKSFIGCQIVRWSPAFCGIQSRVFSASDPISWKIHCLMKTITLRNCSEERSMTVWLSYIIAPSIHGCIYWLVTIKRLHNLTFWSLYWSLLIIAYRNLTPLLRSVRFNVGVFNLLYWTCVLSNKV